jgi:hypothetical protein
LLCHLEDVVEQHVLGGEGVLDRDHNGASVTLEHSRGVVAVGQGRRDSKREPGLVGSKQSDHQVEERKAEVCSYGPDERVANLAIIS